MTCTTCNGWGVVLRVRTPPPSNTRLKQEEMKKALKMYQLDQQVCTSCGGYGTRPQR